MFRRVEYARMTSGPEVWSRRQAQGVASLVIVVVVLLLVGVFVLLRPGSTSTSRAVRTPHHEETTPAIDAIAASPFPQIAAERARPGELSTREVAPMLIPMASAVGAASVPSGYPRTPEGAVAQLAAIDRSALSSASIQTVQEIIRAWAAPGGPTPESWSAVAAMASMLSSAGLSSAPSSGASLNVVPAMALVKGAVGVPGAESSVVPCLQMVVTLTYAGSAYRTAVADCQRMVWMGDRWLIGAGPEPAPVPSLWPGCSEAYDLGFRWMEDGAS